MKIKVSKVFADFINKTAMELNFPVHAQVVNLSENSYRWNVTTNIWDAEEYGDYDWTKGTFKAIMLTYPEDYYACPGYLTTKELNKEFKRLNVSDMDGLKNMVRGLCEI